MSLLWRLSHIVRRSKSGISPSHSSSLPTILHWHVVTDTLLCAAEKEMDRNETYYPCKAARKSVCPKSSPL